MKTKIIIVGKPGPEEYLNPIEFRLELNRNAAFLDFSRTDSVPSRFKYIELICKNYGGGFDLMFAYNDLNKRNKGTFFVGQFNDGIVN